MKSEVLIAECVDRQPQALSHVQHHVTEEPLAGVGFLVPRDVSQKDAQLPHEFLVAE